VLKFLGQGKFYQRDTHMTKYLKSSFIIVLLCLFSKAWASGNRSQGKWEIYDVTPIDQFATVETRNLMQNLVIQSAKGFIFGHQNAEKEGRGWLMDGTPDVYQVSGKHSGVVGFDFKDVAQWEDKYYDFYLKKMKKVYDRGGVVTMSWHMYNPLTGKNFYDKTPAIHSILPGGKKHKFFLERLDLLAKFCKSAFGSDGKLIPIIFRPWHEHTGRWFWWGNSIHSGKKEEEEFINLWRFTVDYLRNEKRVHNILYAYSPDKFKNVKGFFYKYPGDHYVDILGHDNYSTSTDDMHKQIVIMLDEAQKRKKVMALTETGVEGVPYADYWTKRFLNPVKRYKGIAYIMVWRNAHDNKKHHFGPYPGHKSVPSFLKMEKSKKTFFAEDLDLYR
jgi:mannan endo-1,4-beta-mannosidase